MSVSDAVVVFAFIAGPAIAMAGLICAAHGIEMIVDWIVKQCR